RSPSRRMPPALGFSISSWLPLHQGWASAELSAPGIDLALCLVAVLPVALLYPADQLVALAGDQLPIVVGELAPTLPRLALHLLPLPFDTVPVHACLRGESRQGASAMPRGRRECSAFGTRAELRRNTASRRRCAASRRERARRAEASSRRVRRSPLRRRPAALRTLFPARKRASGCTACSS